MNTNESQSSKFDKENNKHSEKVLNNEGVKNTSFNTPEIYKGHKLPLYNKGDAYLKVTRVIDSDENKSEYNYFYLELGAYLINSLKQLTMTETLYQTGYNLEIKPYFIEVKCQDNIEIFKKPFLTFLPEGNDDILMPFPAYLQEPPIVLPRWDAGLMIAGVSYSLQIQLPHKKSIVNENVLRKMFSESTTLLFFGKMLPNGFRMLD